MLRLLRNNDSVTLLLAPVLLIAGAVLQAVFAPRASLELSLFPLLDSIVGLEFLNRLPALNALLSVVLAMATLILFNRMIQQQGLLGRLSNLPVMVAVLLYFMLPAAYNSAVLWLCLLALVFFISGCIDIVSGGNTEAQVFNTALVSGLLGLICPVFLVSWFIIIQAVVYAGALSVRRLLVALVGLALPFYFAAALMYLFNTSSLDLFALFDLGAIEAARSTNDLIVILGFAVVVIAALLISNLTLFSSSTIREKRKWNLIGTLFILMVAVSFVVDISLIPAVSFLPAVIILSNVLAVHANKWITEPLFFILLSLAVLVNVL